VTYFAVVVCVLALLLRLLDDFWFACFGPLVGAFIGAFIYCAFTFYVLSSLFSRELANRAVRNFMLLGMMFASVFFTWQTIQALALHEVSPELVSSLQKFVGYFSGGSLIWFLTRNEPPQRRNRTSRVSHTLKLLLAKLQPRYVPVRRS